MRCGPSVGWGASRAELSALLAHKNRHIRLTAGDGVGQLPSARVTTLGHQLPLEVVEQRHDFWRFPRAVVAAIDEDRLQDVGVLYPRTASRAAS